MKSGISINLNQGIKDSLKAAYESEVDNGLLILQVQQGIRSIPWPVIFNLKRVIYIWLKNQVVIFFSYID